MAYGVVYLLTNLTNGKYYIGQTVDYAVRMRQHRRAGNKCSISHAIKKYGWGNFASEILGEAEDDKSLDNLEKLWIIVSRSVETGYNLEYGGANGKPSDETRRRQSDAKRGRRLSAEHKRNIGEAHKGRKRPPHVREALLKSLIGRTVPVALRQKIANKLKGHVMSAEQRQKLSQSLKGRTRSAEHSRNLSVALMGHAVSQETRDKISRTKRGG